MVASKKEEEQSETTRRIKISAWKLLQSACGVQKEDSIVKRLITRGDSPSHQGILQLRSCCIFWKELGYPSDQWETLIFGSKPTKLGKADLERQLTTWEEQKSKGKIQKYAAPGQQMLRPRSEIDINEATATVLTERPIDPEHVATKSSRQQMSENNVPKGQMGSHEQSSSIEGSTKIAVQNQTAIEPQKWEICDLLQCERFRNPFPVGMIGPISLSDVEENRRVLPCMDQVSNSGYLDTMSIFLALCKWSRDQAFQLEVSVLAYADVKAGDIVGEATRGLMRFIEQWEVFAPDGDANEAKDLHLNFFRDVCRPGMLPLVRRDSDKSLNLQESPLEIMQQLHSLMHSFSGGHMQRVVSCGKWCYRRGALMNAQPILIASEESSSMAAAVQQQFLGKSLKERCVCQKPGWFNAIAVINNRLPELLFVSTESIDTSRWQSSTPGSVSFTYIDVEGGAWMPRCARYSWLGSLCCKDRNHRLYWKGDGEILIYDPAEIGYLVSVGACNLDDAIEPEWKASIYLTVLSRSDVMCNPVQAIKNAHKRRLTASYWPLQG